MQLDNVFGIAGTALNAQAIRMNTTASNLANANSVAGSEEEAYRGRRPLFKALMEEQMTHGGAQFVGGVKVDRIVNDPSPIRKTWEPGNPLADKEGYVFHSNVNEMSEMVDMMAASRSYQNNVEVVNTARQLMMRTLEITKS
ncbi:flagellar basal body rod protein FlgC [Limnohabitans sp.]|jgi:flagellar basal-body rod protein FlgC|uniref:flagellar basal body rod protein FlgC n=1 Tax=Limnohabitans sp. TaxID=1907725 RepID=UPI00286F6156|nr:flagellar basal body rod protein FlgC [Limnohabitans sp.]